MSHSAESESSISISKKAKLQEGEQLVKTQDDSKVKPQGIKRKLDFDAPMFEYTPTTRCLPSGLGNFIHNADEISSDSVRVQCSPHSSSSSSLSSVRRRLVFTDSQPIRGREKESLHIPTESRGARFVDLARPKSSSSLAHADTSVLVDVSKDGSDSGMIPDEKRMVHSKMQGDTDTPNKPASNESGAKRSALRNALKDRIASLSSKKAQTGRLDENVAGGRVMDDSKNASEGAANKAGRKIEPAGSSQKPAGATITISSGKSDIQSIKSITVRKSKRVVGRKNQSAIGSTITVSTGEAEYMFDSIASGSDEQDESVTGSNVEIPSGECGRNVSFDCGEALKNSLENQALNVEPHTDAQSTLTMDETNFPKDVVESEERENNKWKADMTGIIETIPHHTHQVDTAIFRVEKVVKEYLKNFLYCQPAYTSSNYEFYHVGPLKVDRSIIVVLRPEFHPPELIPGKLFRIFPPWHVLSGNGKTHIIGSEKVQLVQFSENEEPKLEGEGAAEEPYYPPSFSTDAPEEALSEESITNILSFDLQILDKDAITKFDTMIRNIIPKWILHTGGHFSLILTVRKIKDCLDGFMEIMASDANNMICFIYVDRVLYERFQPLDVDVKYGFRGIRPLRGVPKQEQLARNTEGVPSSQDIIQQFRMSSFGCVIGLNDIEENKQ